MSRSGWCATDLPHEAAHKVCQMRQDEPDERKRIRPCACGEHGGHTTKEED